MFKTVICSPSGLFDGYTLTTDSGIAHCSDFISRVDMERFGKCVDSFLKMIADSFLKMTAQWPFGMPNISLSVWGYAEAFAPSLKYLVKVSNRFITEFRDVEWLLQTTFISVISSDDCLHSWSLWVDLGFTKLQILASLHIRPNCSRQQRVLVV